MRPPQLLPSFVAVALVLVTARPAPASGLARRLHGPGHAQGVAPCWESDEPRSDWGCDEPLREAPLEEVAGRSETVAWAMDGALFPREATLAGAPLRPGEIEPVFSMEPFASAKARADEGRWSQAQALLAGADLSTPQRVWLAAAVARRAGRHAAAADLFERGAAHPWPLADRCWLEAGLARTDAGQLDGAARALRRVSPGTSLHRDAQFTLARVLKRKGDLVGALEAIGPVAAQTAPAYGWDWPGDALELAAEIEEARGRPSDAAALYVRLWSEHPRSRFSAAALGRARALGVSPAPDRAVRRAELLVEANRDRQAAELVEPLVGEGPALEPALGCRARFALGKARRKMRMHAPALESLGRVVAECGGEEVWARALYVAGASASVLDPDGAVDLYRRLSREAPDHALADDALFLEAEQLQRLGRLREARRELLRLAKLYQDSTWRPEALFRAAWVERSGGRLEDALARFDALAREDGAGVEAVHVERALYWRARTLLDLGRRVEGQRGLEELTTQRPASYYAVLARARAAQVEPGRAPSPVGPALEPVLSSLDPGRLRGDLHLEAAIELVRMGFGATAAEELMSIDRDPLRGAGDRAALRLIATLLDRSGEVRLAHAVARVELSGELTGRPLPEAAGLWRIAFPRAFRSEIERHAAAAAVDPDLVQALIREESALDPQVQSWAGAVGLCQLMLPTAREVARALGLKGPVTPDRLHDPDLNIRLGATYLSGLVRRFHGNLALALAAYNAGPTAVQRWRAAGRAREVDEFVEEIAVTETREYVKRVLRSYGVYQMLYGGSAAAAVPQILATR